MARLRFYLSLLLKLSSLENDADEVLEKLEKSRARYSSRQEEILMLGERLVGSFEDKMDWRQTFL